MVRARVLIGWMTALALGYGAWLWCHADHPSIAASSSTPPTPDAERPTASAVLLVDSSSTPELRRAIADDSANEQMRPETAAEAEIVDVEVCVSEDERPKIGSQVTWYRDEAEFTTFLVDELGGAVAAQRLTDETGTAHFSDLRAGRYGLAVGERNAETCRLSVTLVRDRQRARLVLPVGTAGIEGRVVDDDGQPAAGERVLARQIARTGEAAVWFLARTDASGRYRMGGLAGGEGREVTAMVLDRALGTTLPLRLALGEWRELDFGTGLGRVRWTGVVLLPSGAALHGPGRLSFVLRGGSVVEDGSFDSDGRFQARMSGGAYEAHLGSPTGPVLGVADVVGESVADLVVPGIVLRGRVTYLGTKHPFPRGPIREVVISLERADGLALSPSLVRGEDTYAFCGLGPGDYVLTTRPWILAGTPAGHMPVQIRAEASEVEFDLAITDP